VSRYGSDFQIDLDRQIARVRLERPQALDFAALAEGVRRNNMGLAGFRLEARAAVSGGKVRIEPARQEFLLHGAAPPDGSPAWRTLRVHRWDDPSKIALEVLPQPPRFAGAPVPGSEAEALPAPRSSSPAP
jgi:hypothetical protein